MLHQVFAFNWENSSDPLCGIEKIKVAPRLTRITRRRPSQWTLALFYCSFISGAFATSWENRRCRFIVHTADVSALVPTHAFPECTTNKEVTMIVLHLAF